MFITDEEYEKEKKEILENLEPFKPGGIQPSELIKEKEAVIPKIKIDVAKPYIPTEEMEIEGVKKPEEEQKVFIRETPTLVLKEEPKVFIPSTEMPTEEEPKVFIPPTEETPAYEYNREYGQYSVEGWFQKIADSIYGRSYMSRTEREELTELYNKTTARLKEAEKEQSEWRKFWGPIAETNEVSNLRFAQRTLENLLDKDKGAVEKIFRGFEDFFVKGDAIAYLNSIFSTSETVERAKAFEKAARGEALTPEEESFIIKEKALYAREKYGSFTDKYLVGTAESIPSMIAFVTEFALTDGIFNSLKTGAMLKLTPKTMTLGGKVLPWFNRSIPIKTIPITLASSIIGGLGQSAAMLPRIAPDLARFLLPEYKYNPEATEEDLMFTLERNGDSFGKALAKAVGIHLGEVMLERIGFVLDDPVDFVKRATIRKFLTKRGITNPVSALKFFDKIGFSWNHILGEVFEEEVQNLNQSLIEGEEIKPFWNTAEGFDRLTREVLGVAGLAGLGAVNQSAINLRNRIVGDVIGVRKAQAKAIDEAVKDNVITPDQAKDLAKQYGIDEDTLKTTTKKILESIPVEKTQEVPEKTKLTSKESEYLSQEIHKIAEKYPNTPEGITSGAYKFAISAPQLFDELRKKGISEKNDFDIQQTISKDFGSGVTGLINFYKHVVSKNKPTTETKTSESIREVEPTTKTETLASKVENLKKELDETKDIGSLVNIADAAEKLKEEQERREFNKIAIEAAERRIKEIPNTIGKEAKTLYETLSNKINENYGKFRVDEETAKSKNFKTLVKNGLINYNKETGYISDALYDRIINNKLKNKEPLTDEEVKKLDYSETLDKYLNTLRIIAEGRNYLDDSDVKDKKLSIKTFVDSPIGKDLINRGDLIYDSKRNRVYFTFRIPKEQLDFIRKQEEEEEKKRAYEEQTEKIYDPYEGKRPTGEIEEEEREYNRADEYRAEIEEKERLLREEGDTMSENERKALEEEIELAKSELRSEIEAPSSYHILEMQSAIDIVNGKGYDSFIDYIVDKLELSRKEARFILDKYLNYFDTKEILLNETIDEVPSKEDPNILVEESRYWFQPRALLKNPALQPLEIGDYETVMKKLAALIKANIILRNAKSEMSIRVFTKKETDALAPISKKYKQKTIFVPKDVKGQLIGFTDDGKSAIVFSDDPSFDEPTIFLTDVNNLDYYILLENIDKYQDELSEQEKIEKRAGFNEISAFVPRFEVGGTDFLKEAEIKYEAALAGIGGPKVYQTLLGIVYQKLKGKEELTLSVDEELAQKPQILPPKEKKKTSFVGRIRRRGLKKGKTEIAFGIESLKEYVFNGELKNVLDETVTIKKENRETSLRTLLRELGGEALVNVMDAQAEVNSIRRKIEIETKNIGFAIDHFHNEYDYILNNPIVVTINPDAELDPEEPVRYNIKDVDSFIRYRAYANALENIAASIPISFVNENLFNDGKIKGVYIPIAISTDLHPLYSRKTKDISTETHLAVLDYQARRQGTVSPWRPEAMLREEAKEFWKARKKHDFYKRFLKEETLPNATIIKTIREVVNNSKKWKNYTEEEIEKLPPEHKKIVKELIKTGRETITPDEAVAIKIESIKIDLEKNEKMLPLILSQKQDAAKAGDLRENAAYQIAKDEEERCRNNIKELKTKLKAYEEIKTIGAAEYERMEELEKEIIMAKIHRYEENMARKAKEQLEEVRLLGHYQYENGKSMPKMAIPGKIFVQRLRMNLERLGLSPSEIQKALELYLGEKYDEYLKIEETLETIKNPEEAKRKQKEAEEMMRRIQKNMDEYLKIIREDIEKMEREIEKENITREENIKQGIKEINDTADVFNDILDGNIEDVNKELDYLPQEEQDMISNIFEPGGEARSNIDNPRKIPDSQKEDIEKNEYAKKQSEAKRKLEEEKTKDNPALEEKLNKVVEDLKVIDEEKEEELRKKLDKMTEDIYKIESTKNKRIWNVYPKIFKYLYPYVNKIVHWGEEATKMFYLPLMEADAKVEKETKFITDDAAVNEILHSMDLYISDDTDPWKLIPKVMEMLEMDKKDMNSPFNVYEDENEGWRNMIKAMGNRPIPKSYLDRPKYAKLKQLYTFGEQFVKEMVNKLNEVRIKEGKAKQNKDGKWTGLIVFDETNPFAQLAFINKMGYGMVDLSGQQLETRYKDYIEAWTLKRKVFLEDQPVYRVNKSAIEDLKDYMLFDLKQEYRGILFYEYEKIKRVTKGEFNTDLTREEAEELLERINEKIEAKRKQMEMEEEKFMYIPEPLEFDDVFIQSGTIPHVEATDMEGEKLEYAVKQLKKEFNQGYFRLDYLIGDTWKKVREIEIRYPVYQDLLRKANYRNILKYGNPILYDTVTRHINFLKGRGKHGVLNFDDPTINQLFNYFKKAAVISILAGTFSVTVVQPYSLSVAAGEFGPHLINGFIRSFRRKVLRQNIDDVSDAIKNKAIALKERAGVSERDSLKEKLTGDPWVEGSWARKVLRKYAAVRENAVDWTLRIMVQFVDSIIADIAYEAATSKALAGDVRGIESLEEIDLNNPIEREKYIEKVSNYANMATERTQASGATRNVSDIRKSPLGAAATVMGTFVISQFSLMNEKIYEARRAILGKTLPGDEDKFGIIYGNLLFFVYFIIMSSILNWLYRKFGLPITTPQPIRELKRAYARYKAGEANWHELVTAPALEILDLVPLANTYKYGRNILVVETLENLARIAYALGTGQPVPKDINVETTIGLALKIPFASQIGKTLRGLTAIKKGYVLNQNERIEMMGWYDYLQSALFGAYWALSVQEYLDQNKESYPQLKVGLPDELNFMDNDTRKEYFRRGASAVQDIIKAYGWTPEDWRHYMMLNKYEDLIGTSERAKIKEKKKQAKEIKARQMVYPVTPGAKPEGWTDEELQSLYDYVK